MYKPASQAWARVFLHSFCFNFCLSAYIGFPQWWYVTVSWNNCGPFPSCFCSECCNHSNRKETDVHYAWDHEDTCFLCLVCLMQWSVVPFMLLQMAGFHFGFHHWIAVSHSVYVSLLLCSFISQQTLRLSSLIGLLKPSPKVHILPRGFLCTSHIFFSFFQLFLCNTNRKLFWSDYMVENRSLKVSGVCYQQNTQYFNILY